MAYCRISSITNPTSSSSFIAGNTVNVTWNYSGQCGDWNVSKIQLQSNYPSGSWSNVSTLFNGVDPATSGSKSVTLPSSSLNYGDYYRLKVTYVVAEEEL